FLPLFGRRIGRLEWRPLLSINVWTAVSFLSFYFSLKLVEPAVAGALQFGTGPILALLIAYVTSGARQPASRLLVCTGLLAGCVVLSISAVTGAGFAVDVTDGWTGLAAVLLSAFASVLVTISSKRLSQLGWATGAII